MKQLPVIVLLTLLALGWALVSCGDNSCYDNGSSLPLASFYMDDNQTTVTGLTIKGIGNPGDSLLLDNSSAKEIYLPLRATVSSTSYAVTRQITIGGGIATVYDTLTFEYEPVAYFHSKECGAMFNFDISHVGYTHNGIDSVVLVTPLVTNSHTPALRIYFTDFPS